VDYKLVYNQIVERAFLEKRSRNKAIYYEKHHFIPKSLGGLNNKENLVLLTAREHFICHKLLVEIYPGNKSMLYAVWNMITCKSKTRKCKVSSREYARIREVHSKLVSEYQKGRSHTKEHHRKVIESKILNGTMNRSEESRTRTSNSLIIANKDESVRMSHGRSGDKNGFYRKFHTEESKKKMRKPKSDKQKENMKKIRESWEELTCPYCNYKSKSKSILIRLHFENCKQNPNYTDSRKIISCSYCNIISTNKSNMTRFHGENCKLKPIKLCVHLL
jgi:hypothetical protein